MTGEQYKALSVKEFNQAAEKYESGHAGVYELRKKDYPPILEECILSLTGHLSLSG